LSARSETNQEKGCEIFKARRNLPNTLKSGGKVVEKGRNRRKEVEKGPEETILQDLDGEAKSIDRPEVRTMGYRDGRKKKIQTTSSRSLRGFYGENVKALGVGSEKGKKSVVH